MRAANGIGQGGSGNGSGGKKGDGKDKNFKGAVTVSYNINYVSGNKKVARTARTSLYKPAYLGKEGGYVVVEVRVNRNGTVTSAVVIESSNSALNDVARKAALNAGTLFNIDPNAPSSNVGTITYTFVAQ
jgi:TonB family protein